MSEYFKGIRSELKPFIPQGVNKVLEIGCGEGGFIQNFEEIVEYWGVEPNKVACDIASQRLIKVLNGTFDEVESEIPRNYFDLIVCNDVIEHMPDHVMFLKKIKEYMKPEGKILISIPNVRYLTNIYELLVRKDWRYREAGILDTTHLRFFTEKSIQRDLSRTDFNIIKFSAINQPQDKLYKSSIFFIVALLLGSDIKYPQFAILVQKVKKVS